MCSTNATIHPIIVGALGSYKSSVTQQAKARRLLSTTTLWQRNFYDNIVRDDEALARIREYIRTNPACWFDDKLHSLAPPTVSIAVEGGAGTRSAVEAIAAIKESIPPTLCPYNGCTSSR